MNTEKYNSVKELIELNRHVIDFGEFGSGVSEEWIKRAENRLGTSFPDSYKWWLKNYGGGTIYGEEIFSVYEKDFNAVVGGDIVYMNELNRKNNITNEKQLVICENNDGIIFYFDLTQKDDSEYPVYESVNHSKFATDFFEFLGKLIQT